MSSRCRAAALRFIKIRPRSVFELREKLAGKGFDPREIDEELEYLVSVELLNDRVFTGMWIRYRLARPFGFRRIITELKNKGIADEIIAQAISDAKGDYAEADVVLELARRRFERIGAIDPDKKRKRVFDFLIRRGFSVDLAMKALKKL